MKHTAVVLLLLLPLAACFGVGGHHLAIGCVVRVEPRLIPSPTRPPPRTINTGETVHGTLSCCHLADEFDVAVITDGTLVVRLRWDDHAHQHDLAGEHRRCGVPKPGRRTGRPSSPRCPRRRGQQYRLRVALQGSDEIPEDRYQLTTGVE